MDSFLLLYPEIVKDAIAVATYEIAEQTTVRDEAAKKVQRLRAIDSTSPYTCIGSDAGQAEIAYNIEEAWLKHVVVQLELIKEWADKYLLYIQSHTDTYDFTSFQTFSDFYTAINKNHIQRLINGYRFECKCQFYGHTIHNPPTTNHIYINGDTYCSWGVPVYLSGIKSAINTIGFIGCNEPSDVFYPIPNTYNC